MTSFSSSEINKIQSLKGHISQRAAAERFSVSYSTIQKIWNSPPQAPPPSSFKTLRPSTPFPLEATCSRCGGLYTRSKAYERICGECKSLTQNTLTSRDWQVVGLLALAKTNRQIAEELCLSENSIKAYVARIIKKLGAPNRTAVALFGKQQQAAAAEEN